MLVEINGQKIPLTPKNVKVAKETLSHFLEASEQKSIEQNAPLYKYTLYVVGYIMFSEKIKDISPEAIKMILEAAEKSENKKQQKE